MLPLERPRPVLVGGLGLGKDLLQLGPNQLAALDQRRRDGVDSELLLLDEPLGFLHQRVEERVRHASDRHGVAQRPAGGDDEERRAHAERGAVAQRDVRGVMCGWIQPPQLQIQLVR